MSSQRAKKAHHVTYLVGHKRDLAIFFVTYRVHQKKIVHGPDFNDNAPNTGGLNTIFLVKSNEECPSSLKMCMRGSSERSKWRYCCTKDLFLFQKYNFSVNLGSMNSYMPLLINFLL